jgi:HlyD family secretion protein
MANHNDTRKSSKKRLIGKIGAALLAIAAAFFFYRNASRSDNTSATFTAKRGPLDIAVLEGGSIQALESQEVKCEVRVGYQGTKILKIVEEGYQVTEDDVKNGKVLVELDSSELEKQITQQEIQFQSAAANLTDAQQAYEIQLIQNQADIKAAEQKSRFARMDFDKFLGDITTRQIIEELGIDKAMKTEQANAAEKASAVEKAMTAPPPAVKGPPDGGLIVAQIANGDSPRTVVLAGGTDKPLAGSGAPPAQAVLPQASTPAPAPIPEGKLDETDAPKLIPVDFSKYAKIEALGDGEAKQKLRKLEDDLQVAKKELGQSTTTLEGTARLYEKGFVTKTDKERDEIAHQNSRLKVQTAETAQELFLKYEFPKLAEESLSKHIEAVRELNKAEKSAISKLAQAEAKLKSAQGQYSIQLRQRKELNEQLEKCTIRARKPGLVVYGGGRDDMYYYGGEERIREGATVRERQAIITIPDLSRMAVNVKIHESYIKKVKKGQKVRITVDAFPDKSLEGEVTKVGVLPDSQNRWMNPDLKVYLTQITIGATQDWIKPGMSAKAEILVGRLDDVVYVPVQAVVPIEGKRVCYVANGLKPDRREVEIGEFNDEFIEIKSGIKEGERVLLRPPEAAGPAGGKAPEEQKGKTTTPEPGSSPTTAVPTGKA